MVLAVISGSVGEDGTNRAEDVRQIQSCLAAIGKYAGPTNGICDPLTIKGIKGFQSHFMRRPDGRIDPGGQSLGFLNAWKEKPISPGVQLPGQLRTAWNALNPLLPEGSFCSSGYRTPDQQRTILRSMYTDLRPTIIAKYGQARYDSVAKHFDTSAGSAREPWEDEMLAMVRATGQAIAKPGQSPHQRRKAFDIGGPRGIDAEQVRVAKLVARANPQMFTGKVLLERNGCVHVEIG